MQSSQNDDTTRITQCNLLSNREFTFSSNAAPPSVQVLSSPLAISRQGSNLSSASTASSMGSIGSGTGRRRKAKAWLDRHEETAVIIAPINAVDVFKNLIQFVFDCCGEFKSHYFRDEHSCAIVYFFNEETARKCKKLFNGRYFWGRTLTACSPSQFFPNEEDVLPAKPQHKSSVMNSLSPSIATEPSETLILKNVSFQLRQDHLCEYVSMIGCPPQTVSYHYDLNGMFRGVAFIKFANIELAKKAKELLQGKPLNGRVLRVEFKRRMGIQVQPTCSMFGDSWFQESEEATPTTTPPESPTPTPTPTTTPTPTNSNEDEALSTLLQPLNLDANPLFVVLRRGQEFAEHKSQGQKYPLPFASFESSLLTSVF